FPLILLFCVIGVYGLRHGRLPHAQARLRAGAACARVRARAAGRGVDPPVPVVLARRLRHLVDSTAGGHVPRRDGGGDVPAPDRAEAERNGDGGHLILGTTWVFMASTRS